MREVGQWKATLRDALREALRAREADAVAVLRGTLAAIDNAEAASLDAAPLYASLGRHDEAERLTRQHAVLEALLV